ncbi:hypothetical protein TNCV_1726961 [Trichonephila clavipes]|nr:hypothetical protein TNCV_1726961 [Trichonephila clavipes]
MENCNNALHLLTVTATITSQDVGRSILGSHCNLDKQDLSFWTWIEVRNLPHIPAPDMDGIGTNFKNRIPPEGRAPRKRTALKKWTSENS